MKRIRFCLLLLALVLVFSGCAGRITAHCIEKTQEDTYQLRLPASGQVIQVQERYAPCLPYVKDDLVAQAERKIAEQVSQHGEGSGYYLNYDEEGWLCLAYEVIADLEVDPESECQSGCGIDHEHLFFRERISTKPLPEGTTDS